MFPALAVSYYSNKKGLKAELGSDRLLGVPLETYIAWLCEVQRYDRRESNLCVDKVGVFNAEEVGISLH